MHQPEGAGYVQSIWRLTMRAALLLSLLLFLTVVALGSLSFFHNDLWSALIMRPYGHQFLAYDIELETSHGRAGLWIHTEIWGAVTDYMGNRFDDQGTPEFAHNLDGIPPGTDRDAGELVKTSNPWGFHYDLTPDTFHGYSASTGNSHPGWSQSLVVPDWAVAILGIPGLIWAIQVIRRKRAARRETRKLCAVCQYDLRHSPGVCPECGTPSTRSDKPRFLSRKTSRALLITCDLLIVLMIFAVRQQRAWIEHMNVTEDLSDAVSDRDPARAIQLLRRGADPRIFGGALVQQLVARHFPMALAEALRHGADPSADPRDEPSGLEEAIENRDLECAAILLDAGAATGPTSKVRRQIHYLIRDDEPDLPMLRLLLAHHLDLSPGSTQEVPLLAEAVAAGKPEIVRLMLEAGADPNVTCDSLLSVGGATPLHLIASHDILFETDANPRLEIAQLLVSHHANVDALNANHQTPLHTACFFNEDEIAELLLAHHARLDIRDNDGHLPIHIAAANSRTPLNQLLIDHGANLSATDAQGNLPYQCVPDDAPSLAQLLMPPTTRPTTDQTAAPSATP